MVYKVEGCIGEFDIPLSVGTKGDKVSFKIIPTSEFTHEFLISGKTTRKILMIGDRGSVLSVDENKKFSIDVGCAWCFSASIVALSVAKAKVRIVCDKNRKVSSLTVL